MTSAWPIKGVSVYWVFFVFEVLNMIKKKKSVQEFHHQHKAAALESLHKRIACLCSPVLSSVKGKISTVTQSTTVTI